MKISLKILIVAGLYAIVSIWASCKHHPILTDEMVKTDTTGNKTTDTTKTITTGIPCSSDSTYFQNAILPLIQSNCAGAGCHDSSSHIEGLNLTTYMGIMRIVTPGNPATSRLYTVLSATGEAIMPPKGRPALTQAQINEIYNWILQGAHNNHCDECDTTNISYATNILPILQSECYSCHTGSAPISGIPLGSYNDLLGYVQNGTVYGDIHGLSGYNLMPQSGKLPPCYINQIDAWINQGAKNN